MNHIQFSFKPNQRQGKLLPKEKVSIYYDEIYNVDSMISGGHLESTTFSVAHDLSPFAYLQFLDCEIKLDKLILVQKAHPNHPEKS